MPQGTLKTMLAGGVCAFALAAGGMAAAQTRDFDVPAGDLGSALETYARQSGVQIIYRIADVSGVRTQGAKGALSSDEALAQLLEGTRFKIRRDPSGAIAIADASDPQSGSAAGDGADSGTVQALIVTAQKREEDIQDVPIAISAFTQEDLTRSQVAGGPDLVTQIPNFTFTKTNFSGYSIQIRGIGTQAISATTDPAVAVAFNNTPFIRNRFFEQEFYDLERVEVLRGPQGTLYGRNATGGVVNIISAKPKFSYEARLSADVGNYSSSRLEGMVNIPLVEDTVALRLAGAWTKRDGYATNEITGNPIDGRDLWSTRVSLRVQPADGVNANLIWEHFEENDDRLRSGKQLCDKDVVTEIGGIAVPPEGVWGGPQGLFSQGCKRNSLYSPDSFQTPNGLMLPYYAPLAAIGLPAALNDPYASRVQSPDLRVIESALDPKYRAHNDLGELQISYDLGHALTLTSETAYAVDSVYSMQDFNRFNTAAGAWGGNSSDLSNVIARGVLRTDLGPNLVFCDPQLGCSDRLVAVDISTAKARQFSEELRLSSDFGGRFNFSLGANYLRGDSEDKYYVFFNSLSLIAIEGNPSSGYGQYYPNQTDNSDCLLNGYAYSDPATIHQVQLCVYVDPNSLASVNDQGHNYFLSKNPYKLISYALFGEAYYNLADNLKITAGLRWTVDKKDAPRIPTWILASQSYGYPVAEVIQQEWREPTGRLAIDWKPDLSFTDETLFYASYAHGYKAGGANPPGFVRTFYAITPQGIAAANASVAQSATRPRTFDPEFVNAFEVGSKNTFDEGKATLNLAGFYYDYTGYQVSEIVDRSAFNRNFDATVWGVELEGNWRPVENLKLGLKAGYEKTRIANGEQAIDLMDRTAGNPNWTLLRPFPTYASSCILPTSMFARDDGIHDVGGVSGGNASGCELAYVLNQDPVTEQPYDPNTYITDNGFSVAHPYTGFDPQTAPNHGEGIMKPLGGNELPNAPHFTATVTGDYTLPLANDWLMTLHSDVHWQSQSWWRVFNDNAFDKLHPYFTMNLAAIFSNEDQGWNIMAYIKNVTDETAITGAFLNSDDTGLTTNVFLTEPRLYGLRITKAWTGGPLIGSFGAPHDGPYRYTVELGGQLQQHDAPNQALHPSQVDAFASPFNIYDSAQGQKLDWGDGGDVRLTYRPGPSPWSVFAAFRYGETNGMAAPHAQQATPPECALGGPFAFYCSFLAGDSQYDYVTKFSVADTADARVYDREDHLVGNLGVGLALSRRSIVGARLQYVSLSSKTRADLYGIPDWYAPPGFMTSYFDATPVAWHTRYNISSSADRKFKGAGPVVSWDASYPLLKLANGGRVDLGWSTGGGVLFGQQTTTVTTNVKTRYYEFSGYNLAFSEQLALQPAPTTTTIYPTVELSRSQSATVPTFDASLGLSYEAGAFKLGAGYRWERYFNAIDGGYQEHKSYDRTIDGPYFKIAVGFGG